MLAEITVGFAILAALVFAIRHFVREAKGKNDTSCCCCGKDASCKKDDPNCGQGDKR